MEHFTESALYNPRASKQQEMILSCRRVRLGYIGPDPVPQQAILRNSVHVEKHHFSDWTELITNCTSLDLIWANIGRYCLSDTVLEHYRQHCYETALIVQHDELCPRPPADIGVALPTHNRLRLNLLLDVITEFINTLDTGQTARRNTEQHVAILHDDNSHIADMNELDRFVKLLEFESTFSLKSSPNVEDNGGRKKHPKLQYKMTAKVTEFRVSSRANLQSVLDHLTQFNVDIRQSGSVSGAIERQIIVIAISNLELVMGVLRNLRRLSGRHPLSDNSKWLVLVPSNVEWPEEIYWICSQLDGIYFVEWNQTKTIQKKSCPTHDTNKHKQTLLDAVQSAFQQLHHHNQSKAVGKNRLLSVIRSALDSFEHCETFKMFGLTKSRLNDRVLRNGITQLNPGTVHYRNDRHEYATWHPVRGLRIKRQITDSRHDSGDFRNRALRIGIGAQVMYMKVKTNQGEKNETRLEGVTYEIILVLAAKLNFTPQFILADTYKDKTQWPKEILTKVTSGEYDMSGNAFHKTMDRGRKVFLTTTIGQTDISVLMKKTQEDNRYLFLSPFTWDAWLFIVSIVLGMGPILWLVNRSSVYYRYYPTNTKIGLFRMSNCVWYCFGAIVQQGGDHLPNAISGRVLVTFWWLFVIVTVTTYSGNLVAVLTFPKIFDPINNIHDLIRHRERFRIYVANNSTISDLFNESHSSAIKQLRESYEFYKRSNLQDILNRIKQNTAVILGSSFNNKNIIQDDFFRTGKCSLALVREPIYTSEMVMLINHQLPQQFIEQIDREIRRMAKTGLVAVWRRKYELKGNDCLNPLLIRNGSIKKIEMDHLLDCFVLLVFGLVISTVFFLLENWIERRAASKRSRIKSMWRKVVSARLQSRQLHRRLWHKLLTSTRVFTHYPTHCSNEAEPSQNETVNYIKSHHLAVNTLAQIRRAQRFEPPNTAPYGGYYEAQNYRSFHT